MNKPIQSSLSALVALVVLGCNQPNHLEIKPKEVLLKRKNDGTWVQCLGKNRAGHDIPKVACTWKIGDEKIAVIDKDGKLQGRASGQTTVYAKHGDLEAEASVRVEGVERIEVEP